MNTQQAKNIVIKFAGDSGDGMQLTGTQFTHSSAVFGNDLATFPDFPAEIRAPAGTLAGVSGFQLHFGSVEILTPGDEYDVLVAMNAAAFKVNIDRVKPGAIIIFNSAGFESKNLRLAGYEDYNPLEDLALEDKYTIFKVDITKLTRESLDEFEMDGKEVDRSKNMFVLGLLYWMFDRELKSTSSFLEDKFHDQPKVLAANLKVLQDGYHFGDTTEFFTTRYQVDSAHLPPGEYRNIMGNQAMALGLEAFALRTETDLFYGSYPITPASDILHELSKHRDLGVITFQAEDEIAAVTAAIGASFGGSLGVCGTSGPGMALKAEAIGLAIATELPLVLINVQRAGPSTGMPTKTEQADLLQAVYGRNSESPLAVLAARSPGDCFYMAMMACKISIEYMTPVILLSDGYIANGSEPWMIPKVDDLIVLNSTTPSKNGVFQPYQRNEELVRPWAVPGMAGFEHRLGGLEKDDVSGNISYDPENHEHMVKTRAQKIENIQHILPEAKVNCGPDKGKLLILGWGSTYGAIEVAVKEMNGKGAGVAHLHLQYICPFQKELEEIFASFDSILVPEINNGQLIKILRSEFDHEFIALNKIQGLPFTKDEIIDKANELL